MKTKEHIFTSAVIAAAGSGTRMRTATSKLLIKLGKRPVLAMALAAFDRASEIDEIVVVTREKDINKVKRMASMFGIKKLTAVVCGGDTRQKSIYNALNAVKGELVLIHDGARPFVTQKQINEVAEALYENDAAALGIPVTDTIKSVDGDYITGTIDRSTLVSIQTPQGFKTEIIKKAHENAKDKGLSATDDCALCEEMGVKVKVVVGSSANIKLTTPEDLMFAEGILKAKGEK